MNNNLDKIISTIQYNPATFVEDLEKQMPGYQVGEFDFTTVSDGYTAGDILVNWLSKRTTDKKVLDYQTTVIFHKDIFDHDKPLYIIAIKVED